MTNRYSLFSHNIFCKCNRLYADGRTKKLFKNILTEYLITTAYASITTAHVSTKQYNTKNTHTSFSVGFKKMMSVDELNSTDIL